MEGKSFSKDPLLREYIPFLIVYTKMTRRGRFLTASNKVACDKHMKSLRISITKRKKEREVWGSDGIIFIVSTKRNAEIRAGICRLSLQPPGTKHAAA